MSNINKILILITLFVLVAFWGSIANLFTIIGGAYIDSQVPPRSDQSLIIHIGAGLVYWGWIITLVILFLWCILLVAEELYNRGYRIKIWVDTQ